jgi:hypothetical protein
MANEVLLDVELIVDPDSNREMGVAPSDVLMDPRDLRGARLLVVKREQAAEDWGDDEVLVKLNCSFHPAPGTRFVSARITLSLFQPQGVRFIDIAPLEVKEPMKVEYSRQSGGKITMKKGPIEAEASAQAETKVSYDSYVCRVNGVGAGTDLAYWDFKEDENLRDGVAHSNELALTLPAGRTVKAELVVTARMAKMGGLGALNMILGDQYEKSTPEITLYRERA